MVLPVMIINLPDLFPALKYLKMVMNRIFLVRGLHLLIIFKTEEIFNCNVEDFCHAVRDIYRGVIFPPFYSINGFPGHSNHPGEFFLG